MSRVTVYNHFPSDADHFHVCSSHWARELPFPDPATWRQRADPAALLPEALEELYDWYGREGDMLEARRG